MAKSKKSIKRKKGAIKPIISKSPDKNLIEKQTNIKSYINNAALELAFEDEIGFLDEHKPKGEESFTQKSKIFLTTFVISVFVLGYILKTELLYSNFQSEYFFNLSSSLKKEVLEGEGEVLNSPQGPYDLRLGYLKANEMRKSLLEHGFKQDTFTKVSDKAISLSKFGINFPYKEKNKAGISLSDEKNNLLFKFSEPSWIFEDYNSISKLIVDTLIYIEDRTLLQTEYPKKNPALEWDRFFKAIIDLISSKLFSEKNVPGGSTLATQIEKFKHSDGGRTSEPLDKLRQMFSASLRAYNKSKDTMQVRQDIVLDYINSVPLAAIRGYGEVHGLGDGLWAYFGEDPKRLNELLKSPTSPIDREKAITQAIAYRKVLSLFLAHRRPSEYLDQDSKILQLQVERYLPLLFKEGIIDYNMYKLALSSEVQHRKVLPLSNTLNFSSRKGANVVRTHLMNYLGVSTLYELDRLDIDVHSTINVKAQDEVSRLLLKLKSQDEIRKLGLDGFRLLSTGADPKKVIYSFTLYENQNGYNKLRVQTDTHDQPLNINEGVKLDLGSTSKYRAIITYLEVIEEIFYRYKNKEVSELDKSLLKEKDPLSLWGLKILKANQNIGLTNFLELSLDREYSANPGERFFTAGGLHTFSNFNSDDNGKVLKIRHALRHSVNLPFIRMMRDLVKYYTYHTEGSTALTLSNMSEERRSYYLKKFADQEGKVFIRRFYEKYQNKTPEQIINILLDSTKRIPKRFASIYWFLNPDSNINDFIEFMKKHVDHAALSQKDLEKFYQWYTKVAISLGDKGYLARMHPLELWVAGYLIKNPDSKITALFEQSYNQRIEVYDWLMKTSRKHAQDKRIQILLEAEAFQEIFLKWKRVGYPLSSIVPSYATSLGTSADRPDSLAELMGIVLNNGLRFQKSSVNKIEFAKDTPYEMSFSFKPEQSERILSEELVSVAKPLLYDIVQSGTAIRLKEGIKIGKNIYQVGGKTGTGDHRYQVYGKGGNLLEKRVVNRTATFMFLIGNKYYGVLTAFVPGRDASKFKFTSALPVQLLKIISPALNYLEE